MFVIREASNTSIYVICLNFFLQSPTAIVFLNTSYIAEHSVNTIVYDLNKSQLTGNMSIYGFETKNKPENFKVISP